MYHPITLAFKLVVAGMTLTAMNSILERLGVPHNPIEPKDLAFSFVASSHIPSQDVKPMLPLANFQTTNFIFVFREGKLHMVWSMQTNSDAVEHYRQWAKMPSLINSNEAYHMATNWLSRVYVDVPMLNQKYTVNVGQPGFWMTPPAELGGKGSGWTTLPLYYVTWHKDDYEAAKVGIFGPTKQFMGLTIGDMDKGFDASICSHVYLLVTNEEELLTMTNVPMRIAATNQELLRIISPKPPPDTNRVR
jgi:hypothetical protein